MVIAPLLLSVLAAAQAQPSRPSAPRGYGFVSVGISNHPGNGEAYHRVADQLHGTTWMVGGGGGAFVTPVIGIEAEVLLEGNVSAPQAFHYTFSEEYIANNRDILVNGLLRARAGGPVQLVFGGGFARTRTQSTSLIYIDSFFRRTSEPDRDPFSYVAPTLTAGLDATFATGPHAAIGPSVRVRWVRRPPGGAAGWNGIGPLAFQFGAAVTLR